MAFKFFADLTGDSEAKSHSLLVDLFTADFDTWQQIEEILELSIGDAMAWVSHRDQEVTTSLLVLLLLLWRGIWLLYLGYDSFLVAEY